jgi:hypothetical protein
MFLVPVVIFCSVEGWVVAGFVMAPLGQSLGIFQPLVGAELVCVLAMGGDFCVEDENGLRLGSFQPLSSAAVGGEVNSVVEAVKISEMSHFFISGAPQAREDSGLGLVADERCCAKVKLDFGRGQGTWNRGPGRVASKVVQAPQVVLSNPRFHKMWGFCCVVPQSH